MRDARRRAAAQRASEPVPRSKHSSQREAKPMPKPRYAGDAASRGRSPQEGQRPKGQQMRYERSRRPAPLSRGTKLVLATTAPLWLPLVATARLFHFTRRKLWVERSPKFRENLVLAVTSPLWLPLAVAGRTLHFGYRKLWKERRPKFRRKFALAMTFLTLTAGIVHGFNSCNSDRADIPLPMEITAHGATPDDNVKRYVDGTTLTYENGLPSVELPLAGPIFPNLTAEHLSGIWTREAISQDWLIDGLNDVARRIGLNTPEGFAHFWAQVTKEGGMYSEIFRSSLVEGEWRGLNTDNDFATVSGGADFRGIGPIQLTHDFNYQSFMNWMNQRGTPHPRIMEGFSYVGQNRELMMLSVEWFLTQERRNWVALANEGGTVEELTRQIQGRGAPEASIAERARLFSQFLPVFERISELGRDGYVPALPLGGR